MVPFNHPENENQSLLKPCQLAVRGEIEALEEILIWFEVIAKPYLAPKVLWECKLALSEGFTNTVLYAHRDLPPTVSIVINVNFYQTLIEILIWNQGPFFDLKAKLAQLKQQNINPLDMEGDRSLFFMDKLTDELEYIRFANQRNCLKMRKWLT